MPDPPIVCSLEPDALRGRQRGLLAELMRRAERHELVDDGLRLRFSPDDETLSLIASAVNAERHCCKFLRFIITIEADSGPLRLELTGPPGTREFLSALLDM